MAPVAGQDPRGRALVLIGFMGAGKSTAAVELATVRGGRHMTATSCWKSVSVIRSPASSSSAESRRSGPPRSNSCANC